MAGGVLLIPLNTLFPGFLICLKFNIDYNDWIQCVKQTWILQIIWNLIFFFTCLSLTSVDEGKIDYSLTRKTDAKWDTQSWEYHFYSNGPGGRKEILNDADNVTPFQKAMEETGIEKGLDLDGLPTNEDDLTAKIVAFNSLSYAKARAYIDKFNTNHGGSLWESVFMNILYAVIFPFLWLIPELLIACIIACPLISGIVLGPTIIRFLNTLGFFSAIGDAFRSRA